jgi:hypothetical protein
VGDPSKDLQLVVELSQAKQPGSSLRMQKALVGGEEKKVVLATFMPRYGAASWQGTRPASYQASAQLPCLGL